MISLSLLLAGLSEKDFSPFYCMEDEKEEGEEGKKNGWEILSQFLSSLYPWVRRPIVKAPPIICPVYGIYLSSPLLVDGM